MSNCGIYIIQNNITGMCYVGQSRMIKKRMYEHKRKLKYNKHNNIYLQRSVNKHGIKNFEFYHILECSIEELNNMEIEVIRTLREGKITLYNLDDGGKQHLNMSVYSRIKLSESVKKQWQNMSKEQKEELSKKHSIINKKVWQNYTPEQKEEFAKIRSELAKKQHQNINKKQKEELSKKQSDTIKNKTLKQKEEISKKQSIAAKKRWNNITTEQREDISKNLSIAHKKVWQNRTQEQKEELFKKKSVTTKKTWHNMSKEQKEEISKKYSIAAKKRWDKKHLLKKLHATQLPVVIYNDASRLDIILNKG